MNSKTDENKKQGKIKTNAEIEAEQTAAEEARRKQEEADAKDAKRVEEEKAERDRVEMERAAEVRDKQKQLDNPDDVGRNDGRQDPAGDKGKRDPANDPKPGQAGSTGQTGQASKHSQAELDEFTAQGYAADPGTDPNHPANQPKPPERNEEAMAKFSEQPLPSAPFTQSTEIQNPGVEREDQHREIKVRDNTRKAEAAADEGGEGESQDDNVDQPNRR